MANPSKDTPTSIVLIHGLWLTALSWEHWVERYRKRGFDVVARSWPGLDGDIDALRRDPSPMVNVGLEEVVEHYEKIIDGLGRPVIIMGHSFGGLVTQLLLDRGFGAAGVGIDSAAPKGVLSLTLSEIKSAFPVLKNPANAHRAVALTKEEFHYSFGNTLSEEESAKVWARYAVPGPGRVLWQGATANFNPRAVSKIDFAGPRAPLLLISGSEDHVIPPSVVRENVKRQDKATALTALKEFAGRSHYICGQPGWEEVADYALDWALKPREVYEGL
ncbi:MAG TPA: alpha/beta hydrolase [Myxococcaceae bacterium]|nr:alpha/beta hydrolase [Myxococcaceae bacterium]